MKPLLQVSDASLDPKNIAIKWKRDHMGIIHFRSAPLESTAAARFSRVQALALRGDLLPPSSTRIALSLILFDAIPTREDLEAALGNIDSIYTWNEQVCLDWSDKFNRGNRRFLSVFTQTALATPRTVKLDTAAVLSDLDLMLQKAIRGPRSTYSLDLLLLDAQAWLKESVSEPLVAHCIGAAPIASLPRSVLAREATKLALGIDAAALRSEATSDGFARALAAYFDPTGRDQGSWLIAELVHTCRRNKSLSNSKDRERMLKGCLGLTNRAETAGRISALILAWVIDLLESGTRTKQILKAITPAKYVSAAAYRLLEAFRGKDLDEISVPAFISVYEKMLKGLSSSQARTLASALSSWHFFLTCWFYVDPLYKSLHRWLPVSPPRANLLWPHELELISSWLNTPGSDERLHKQIRIAFEILKGVRIRATELLCLRICNIQFEGNVVRVEVATKEQDGGNKTAAARRTETLTGEAFRLVRDWIERRKKDGALPSDYLFGDPYQPDRQYRTGHVYLTLNRLLKAATGDASVATHAISHTRVSFDWMEAASEKTLADINPFERAAAAAGHESPATGFACYFHFAEPWLRRELDELITRQLGSWASVKNHVTLSASAFRQALSRGRKRNPDSTPGTIAMHYIRQTSPCLIAPAASANLEMVEPKNPIVACDAAALDLAGTLNLLHDLWYGHSPEAIALRCGRPLETVSAYAAVALDVLELVGEVGRHVPDQQGRNAIATLGAALNGPTGQRIQLTRSGQVKVGYLYDHLADNADQDEVVTGIESWIKCYDRGHLSLYYPAAAAGFVALLDAAKFPRSFLVVRAVNDLEPKVKAGIEAIFQSDKPVMPTGELLVPRYGRPRAYLALASGRPQHGKGDALPNAALGMGGVHAVMFGAAVCSRAKQLHFTSTVVDSVDSQGEFKNG